MCNDELKTRKRYPQAEARAAGAAEGWVIRSGRGPVALVIGRGETKEDAWAEAAKHVAAKAA